MNVLVSGATGFIGSHLCRTLVDKGHNVFGMSKSGNVEKILDLIGKDRFSLVKADLEKIDTLNNAFEGKNIETVFHLAAFIPKEDTFESRRKSISINSIGTLNLLEVSSINKVKNFIYSSTMSVYSAPPKYVPVDENHPIDISTIYGGSKLFGEFACNNYSQKMSITILRYSGVYGPFQEDFKAIPKFIRLSLNNKPITLVSGGEQSSDFVYVKDVIKANILSISKPGTFNIGGGKETSIKNLAEKIIELCGSKSKIIYSKENSARPFKFSYSIEKAKYELEFEPVSLEAGLIEFIKYIKT